MTKVQRFVLYFVLAISLLLGVLVLFLALPQDGRQGIFSEKINLFAPKQAPRDTLWLFELPESLTFADEKVPLDQYDVVERLEREVYVNAYWESNLILLLKRSSKYLPVIERILREQGVPADFKYLAIAESGLLNATSSAGAKGYWQFLEDTGKEYGLEITPTVDERYDLEKSTLAATAYFKKAHAKFGSWTAVAASYNMGQTGFANRQQEQGQINYYDLHLNDETSRYLFRVLAFKLLFETPEVFGYHLQEQDFYVQPELQTVNVGKDIPDLALWAKAQGSSYKHLKRHNPWLRDRELQVTKGKTYQIRLPKI
jgi:membrane-bound lytic murein transglycosylase D